MRLVQAKGCVRGEERPTDVLSRKVSVPDFDASASVDKMCSKHRFCVNGNSVSDNEHKRKELHIACSFIKATASEGDADEKCREEANATYTGSLETNSCSRMGMHIEGESQMNSRRIKIVAEISRKNDLLQTREVIRVEIEQNESIPKAQRIVHNHHDARKVMKLGSGRCGRRKNKTTLKALWRQSSEVTGNR